MMTKLEGGRFQDENGLILPWYTSPCLEWLMTLDLSLANIFEYGLGDSTTWYKQRWPKATVCGVDNNEEWVKKVGNSCDHVWRSASNTYPRSIHMFDLQFNLVIIDGIHRDLCTEYALKCLKHGGYLIIDNWMQPSVEMEWRRTEKLIDGMPTTIYKEPNHYDWQTAVIQKP